MNREVTEYEIVPVTLVYVPARNRIEETPCTDAQASEWYIYATYRGARRLILHAVSREIAEGICAILRNPHL